jgi:acyl carrier protein
METAEKVRQFITKNFFVPDDTPLGADTSLLDQGIVDSTGVLEIVSFLEQEFSIEVDDMEILPDNLDSLSKISAFVARKSG